MKKGLLIFILIASSSGIYAQGNIQKWLNPDSVKARKVFGVPTIYFTPETNWAFGAAGFAYFKLDKDSLTRPSSVRFGAAYTLNKQVLAFLPYQLFLKRNKYWLNGELAFYRYPYFFRGVGNDYPEGTFERYDAQFPRFRLTAMRRFGKHVYTGPRYWFQNTDVISVATGEILDTANVVGANGGIKSGFGWVVNYDTRDKIFNPRSGLYLQLESLFNEQIFGSDFNYQTYVTDFRVYLKFLKKHTLAFNLYNQFNFGEVPFNKMAQVGGSTYLRGYQLGWFRDKKLSSFQAEFRSNYWTIFAFNIFAGAGVVSPSISELSLSNLRPAAGFGVRILVDPKERLNLRGDIAFRENGYEIYLTVGEAF